MPANKSVKRTLRYLGHKMFPRNSDPIPVAWSVALGIFIGVLPTIGIAIPLTLLACLLFRIPKAPGVASSFIAIPPTLFFFFYPTGYGLGTLILQPVAIEFDFLERFKKITLSNLGSSVADLWSQATDHFIAFGIGITIVALISAAIGFFFSLKIVSQKREAFLLARIQKQTLKN